LATGAVVVAVVPGAPAVVPGALELAAVVPVVLELAAVVPAALVVLELAAVVPVALVVRVQAAVVRELPTVVLVAVMAGAIMMLVHPACPIPAGWARTCS
jgi:hypothetical protein